MPSSSCIGGYVKVSVRAGGTDLALTYLRKGDYAGESALLLDETWPFTLQALEHVEVVKIPREMFRAITVRVPRARGGAVDGVARAPQGARRRARGQPTSSEYVQMAMETGLIHGESVLLIDLSTCTRCDECVRGCADAHGGEPRFIREGQKYRRWLVPTACYQCTDPVCMIDCPTGAITRQVGTLEVTIDEPTCIGCGNCANRCPWGNIIMVEKEEKRADGKPIEIATKCDLCLTRPGGPGLRADVPARLGGADLVQGPGPRDVDPHLRSRPYSFAAALRPKQPRNLMIAAAAALVMVVVYAIAAWLASLEPQAGHGPRLRHRGRAHLRLRDGLPVPPLARAPAGHGAPLDAGPRLPRRRWPSLAVLIHSGFHLPRGVMGWALLLLSALDRRSAGWSGSGCRSGSPRCMAESLRVEALYERIPALVEHLLKEADDLVANASEVLERFYQTEVRTRLAVRRALLVVPARRARRPRARARAVPPHELVRGARGEGDRRRPDDHPHREDGARRPLQPAGRSCGAGSSCTCPRRRCSWPCS